MKEGIIKFLNYCHYIFFIFFLLLGIYIFKDFGFNIDESFHRRSGFYWLNYLSEFFNLETLSNISNEKFLNANDFTMPWGTYDKSYGLIFDVPAAFLEIILNLEDPIKYYEMRHLLVFLYFFLGIIFFYKLLINRFDNKFIALFGCIILATTPRLFGDSFHNNKDIIFLSIFIITSYSYFKLIDSDKLKYLIVFSLLSALATSTRLFGMIFPLIFLFVYFLSVLSNKKELKKINKLFIYIFLYLIFLFLHWPYLWVDPINKFFSLLNNLDSFGPAVVYFNDTFYNSNLLPYHYLPLWILISTPVVNILLFLFGFYLISKIFISKLIYIEKIKSKYDFWDSSNQKKDFIIYLIFIIFIILGIFFVSKHYNSWRIFYFLNFFFVYFACYFLKNFSKKKYLKIFVILLIFTTSFNFYRLFIYHPYQSLYFNVLALKSFKNKFEVDFTGLSGVKFLRNVTQNDKRDKIKIGINSWYPLWRMKELLSEEAKNRIVIVHENNEEVDYVYSNRIYNVNMKLSNKFTLSKNFKIHKQYIVDNVIIYDVFKNMKK